MLTWCADCKTPFKAREAILHLHSHLAQKGKRYLPEEQIQETKRKGEGELHTGEWTHLSGRQYAIVTKRMDRLFHLD